MQFLTSSLESTGSAMISPMHAHMPNAQSVLEARTTGNAMRTANISNSNAGSVMRNPRTPPVRCAERFATAERLLQIISKRIMAWTKRPSRGNGLPAVSDETARLDFGVVSARPLLSLWAVMALRGLRDSTISMSISMGGTESQKWTSRSGGMSNLNYRNRSSFFSHRNLKRTVAEAFRPNSLKREAGAEALTGHRESAGRSLGGRRESYFGFAYVQLDILDAFDGDFTDMFCVLVRV